MRVTLKDVGREARVSTITVSRVLNGKSSAVPISDATRRRVLDAAARLGYQPNLMARGLRTNRSRIVGVMVEDITDPFFGSLIPPIDATLQERGYHLLLSHAALDPDSGPTYDRLLGSRVDGLLILGDRALSRAKEAEVLAGHRHVVGVAYARDETAIPSFNVDDGAGIRLAVEHLRGLGHERIAFVGNRDAWDMSRRHDTFLATVVAEGLPALDEATVLVPHTAADGYTATRRLLATRVPFTAVICATDSLALGALCALDEAGIRVPRDVSVVGFDDITFAAYATPPLTTVRQPVAELARHAVTYLLDLIDDQISAADGASQAADRPAHGSDQGLLQPELIVRRTTGPCPSRPVAELPAGLSVEKLAAEAPRPQRHQAGRR